MSNADPATAPWLDALNPSDRSAAEIWLNEPGGDARLRRIAEAILKPKRKEGRPKNSRPWLLRRTIEAWMTSPGADTSGAVAIAVDGVSGSDSGNVTPARLRRVAIAEFEIWLEEATFGQISDIADDLQGRGIVLRVDTPHAQLEDGLRALIHRLSGPPSVKPVIEIIADQNCSTAEALLSAFVARQEEYSDRIGRLARFGASLPELFPTDTPASKVAAAYDSARDFLCRGTKPGE